MKKVESSSEVATPSVPFTIAVVAPSTPPTQTVVVVVQSDEEDDVKNLISSLRKFLEKRKSVKSIEKTLSLVLNKIEKVVSLMTPLQIFNSIQKFCVNILMISSQHSQMWLQFKHKQSMMVSSSITCALI